jgi:outer membrane protein
MPLNIKISLTVVALVMANALAGAQAASNSPTGPPPSKVCIIGIQQAIANTNEGKKELDGLQQRFAPKQAELKALNDEIEKLKAQLQAQGDKLSEEARAAQVRTIESKQKLLQRNFDDAQSEFQQAQQEIFNRLGAKMAKILADYAVKNGYGVVLDVSNPQTTPVLYASTNITQEIIDAYNAQSGAAAPASKSGAAAKQPSGAAAAAAGSKAGSATTKRP